MRNVVLTQFAISLDGYTCEEISRTLQTASWSPSRIASGDTAKEIAQLKQEPGGEIVAHGGVRFAQSLARLELIDEYRLYIYPIAIGQGTSVFAGLRP